MYSSNVDVIVWFILFNLAARIIKKTILFQKRLQKELQSMIKDPPVGIRVDQSSVKSSLVRCVYHGLKSRFFLD